MIKISININNLAKTAAKLDLIKNPNPLLRGVVADLLPIVQERIHEDGKAADGSAIGTYSNKYLKMRSQNGRGSDTKKVETFTRQLQNSYGIVATQKGWAIGILVEQRNPTSNYLNKKNKAKNTKAANATPKVSNSDLVKFQESQTGKKIWSLTKEEKEYAANKLKKDIQKILNNA